MHFCVTVRGILVLFLFLVAIGSLSASVSVSVSVSASSPDPDADYDDGKSDLAFSCFVTPPANFNPTKHIGCTDELKAQVYGGPKRDLKVADETIAEFKRGWIEVIADDKKPLSDQQQQEYEEQMHVIGEPSADGWMGQEMAEAKVDKNPVKNPELDLFLKDPVKSLEQGIAQHEARLQNDAAQAALSPEKLTAMVAADPSAAKLMTAYLANPQRTTDTAAHLASNEKLKALLTTLKQKGSELQRIIAKKKPATLIEADTDTNININTNINMGNEMAQLQQQRTQHGHQKVERTRKRLQQMQVVSSSSSSSDSASVSDSVSSSASLPYANLWLRGTVFWKYGRRVAAVDQARFEAKMKKAMHRYEKNTCILFLHKALAHPTITPPSTDIAVFVSAPPRSGAKSFTIGMRRSKRMGIIMETAKTNTRTAAHELGHLLGLQHTFQRSDRTSGQNVRYQPDQCVTAMCFGRRRECLKYDDEDQRYLCAIEWQKQFAMSPLPIAGVYDHGSIMSYRYDGMCLVDIRPFYVRANPLSSRPYKTNKPTELDYAHLRTIYQCTQNKITVRDAANWFEPVELYVGTGGSRVWTAWTVLTIKQAISKRWLGSIRLIGARQLRIPAAGTAAAIPLPNEHVVGDNVGGVVIGVGRGMNLELLA